MMRLDSLRKYDSLLVAVAVGLLSMPSFHAGLYGLDWTDTTYNFQEAINVVNGLRPHNGFSTHVGGLSFLIEGVLLKYFGADYFIHRALGFLIYVISVTLVYKIADRATKNRAYAILLAGVVVFYIAGIQSSFTFTSLALMLSLLIAYIFLNKNEYHNHLIHDALLGIASASLLLIKHNIGLAVFGAIGLSYIINFLLSADTNRSFKGVLVFATSFCLLFTVYFIYIGSGGINAFYNILLSSSELKGLSGSSFLSIIFSLIGVPDGIRAATFCFFLALLITVVLVLQFRMKIYFADTLFPLVVIIGPIFIAMSRLFASDIYNLDVIYFFIFHVLSIYLPLGLIYKYMHEEGSCGKNEISGILSLYFIIEATILAHEASWPGPGYMAPLHAYLLATINLHLFGLSKKFERAINYKAGLAAFVLIIIVISFLVPVRPYGVSAKQRNNYSSINQRYFNNWPVSINDKNTIKDLQLIAKNNNSHSLFQLPWSPILYSLLNLRNTTPYDLPYHDALTIEEAKDLVACLKKDMPDILMIEPQYRVYDGPFPAKGMKYVYQIVDNEIIKKNYRYLTLIRTDYKSWEVYLRTLP
jgi:hypothetical protein